MTRFLCFLLLSAILNLAAWALLASPAASADDQSVVVTFGDSTTATRGELRVYSQVLAEELDEIKVINAGVGGHNTDHAAARFERDVRAHNPDVVVIQFGINDAAVDVWKDPPATKSRVSLEDYEENLRHFVDTLTNDGAAIILMTPNPLRWNKKMREMYGKTPYDPDDEDGFNAFLKRYAGAVRNLAKEKNLPLVDVYQLFETHGATTGQSVDELLLDGVHPNDRGQKIVAEGLIPLLRKKIAERPNRPNSKVELKVVMNPVDSHLSGTGEETTRVRFEDYVSNPPPGKSEGVQGQVAQYPVPFTGLVTPLATNSHLTPLPEPVGLLIESPSGSVDFYDPSSLVDCADPRADQLIFRFVDPDNTNLAATVSRVVFRVTGTSVINENVRFSIHDIAGKTLGSGVAKIPPGSKRAEAEVDVSALENGRRVPLIHKLVVEHSGPGYIVAGGVLRSEEADIGFDGFTVSEQRVKRPIGEQIPMFHSGQWKNFRDAKLVTDMTRCTPADALSQRRKHDKWKVFEYDTAEFSGKCLSVGRESSAPDLTLKLNQKGWHAVYLGISTITDLVRPAPNQIEAKFSGDPAYTRLSNRLGLASPRRDVLEEIFLGVANLTGNGLQFSTVYEMPARLHYVKTIPLTEAEIAELKADRAQKATKTSVATFDGFTWIHPFRPQNRADLAATFANYRDSDFRTWWFQVGGADLVHHLGKVGNLMGGHLDTFPRTVDREYVESVRHLHAQGIDPLKVAVEEAHAQDAEILICLRAAGWKGAPPWEEFFMSEFYEAHPEWRCVDYDGTPVMHLSYAAEEVQDHLIEVYREVLQRNPDGLGFMFHRGLPLMLWEAPFCERFIEKFGEDPRKLPEDDPRVFELRAEIMTTFFRKIRALLDEFDSRKKDSSNRSKFAVTTFATKADNRTFGLDVESWIEEKLIDQIGIAWFAYYTSGTKTKSGDTAYYAKITEGTGVKIHPFYVGWKMKSAAELLKSVARDYEQGADGIAVWDPNQFVNWEEGKAPYWPLVSKLGHREKVRDGSLLYKPVQIPLTRMGENHYSRWYPNTGF